VGCFEGGEGEGEGVGVGVGVGVGLEVSFDAKERVVRVKAGSFGIAAIV
jgi:hypothetical protein